MRTLLLLLLIAGTAEASTKHGPRLAHRVVESIDDDHAVLSFVLGTNKRGPQEVTVPIEIPIGMAATGLSIAMGDDAGMSAVPLRAELARGVYNDVVREIRDPALLEIDADGTMMLSVFPLTRGLPARITIELTAMEKAEGHVTRTRSLVAAPGARERNRDPYADYWPEHRHPEVVAANEP